VSAVPSTIAKPATTVAGSNGAARGTLMLAIPARQAAAHRRSAAYVSPSTTYVTLFIDGATTGFRQSCTPGTTCTVSWNASTGAHVFAVEIDDSTTFSGGGTVLAEGSENVTLVAGTNPNTTITINGVPATIVGQSSQNVAAGTGVCATYGSVANCIEESYAVADADQNLIVPPGNFDDGPSIIVASNAGVALAENSQVVAPLAGGSGYVASFACKAGKTGTFGPSVSFVGGAAAVPEVAAAQLATYALTYPNQAALPFQTWSSYVCANGTLASRGPTGTIAEYAVPTLASGPTSIVAAPDNNLWFTEEYTGRIGTATTAGVVTDASLPGTNYAQDLAVGADGTMWVTLHPVNGGPSLIDQVTIAIPPVTLTQNQIQNTDGIPGCITAGSDGNLWFVDGLYNTIGKIVPSTRIATEYGLPGAYPATYPNCITSGPNGNLWFTIPTTNQIGTMTTAGVVVGEYSVTTAYSTPYDITSGPDGNLWFTEESANKIGVMSPSGTMIAEYAVPAAGSEPSDITGGPDGNLWFTESAGNKIGRITPSGTITEFSVPTAGAGLAGIIAGADGNLWFTEANANQIGKIAP